MRLYRGLKGSYQPERRPEGLVGVDFTDCPLVATLYPSDRQGQVLVLDIPDKEAEMRVSKEFWFDRRAKRLMIWGKFDDYIVGIIPAKELRKIVRAKGMAAMSETDRSHVLKDAIDKALRGAAWSPTRTRHRFPAPSSFLHPDGRGLVASDSIFVSTRDDNGSCSFSSSRLAERAKTIE